MDKTIIFLVSSQNKKYYFDPITIKIPAFIKEEIRETGTYLAEKVNGIFSIGFYQDGSIFLEISSNENDFDYDEIGAKLEIQKLKKEKKELLNSLQLWYKLFLQNVL